MKADEKPCPKCAEPIKLQAVKCKHCGYELNEQEIAEAREKATKQKKAGLIGCGAATVIGLLLLGTCVASGGKSDEELAAETAEDRRKGMHCLSGWDGTSGQFVKAVTSQLRDPESFEHHETRITPVDDEGDHIIFMEYGARNGFGGMNRSLATGVVKQVDCSATVTTLDAS